ncbi:MAG: hypothetical protein JXR96_23090 [Deltaproteobacteria bacterium]|nr:hypothetical protein [Deltaproteobacteria bacterium]
MARSSKLRGLALIATAFLAASLPACLAVRIGRPAWVVSNVHPDYPLSRYFTGAAEGASPEQAEQASRADLIRRLPADLAAAVGAGPAAEIRIAVRWSSRCGSKHAALAVLDRKAMSAGIRGQLAARERRIQALLSPPAAQPPYQRLIDLVVAFELELQSSGQHVQLTAIAPQPPEAPGRDRPMDRIDAYLAKLQIYAARGQGQKLRPGQEIVLSAGVDLDDSAVTGAPLAFRETENSEPARARADKNGWATVKMRLQPGASPRRAITARLDGAAVLEDAGLDPADPRLASLARKLEGAGVQFQLLVPTSKTPRAVLMVVETHEGAYAEQPQLVAEMKRLLVHAGLDVVDVGELAIEGLPAEPSEADIVQALAGKVDWVVLGRAECQVREQVAAGLVFAEASGTLALYRAGDSAAKARFEMKVRGAGRDPGSARLRALGKLAGEALQVFSPQLGEAGKTKAP